MKDLPATTEPAAPPASLAGVLAEIAEVASETLELQQVFDRVANAIRRLIPLDSLGVVRILDGRWLVLHAITCRVHTDTPEAEGMTGPCPQHECSQPESLESWSPRLRPRQGPIARVDDAALELDPAFPSDRRLIEKGVRSAMWEPFRAAEAFGGGVWASAQRAHAFSDEHQRILRPIAALLGSAVEHWRIWDADRRRQERFDRIEALFATLASSLDVREVFQRLSAEIQPILGHDLMTLSELDARAGVARITAHVGECDIPVPEEPIPLTPAELAGQIEAEVIHDILTEVPPGSHRQRLMLASGMRSLLRVPVWLSGEIQGGLIFFHRDPSRYSRDDVDVAHRLADRIALTLSLGRLSEEARIAAEARERAERLEATVATLALELEARGRSRVVGLSRAWKETLRHVGLVAPSETTVLITGESGTGKEVIANLIHQGSARTGKPFVAINCAALPEQLLESELFGHEKGAFTGAMATKIGRLEQAAGGTLFLDEVAEMSPVVQAKLLRVLQEREFHRLGGTRTLRADVRLLAATNRDLDRAIARGEFREDLFYRLNVFAIRVPALRERPEDILPLAEFFLEDLGRSMGRPAAGISRDARGWLLSHPWPGNARELRNTIERAILLCDGGLITREHLPPAPGRDGVSARPHDGVARLDGAPFPPLGMDLESVERSLVQKALGESGGNKSKAARLLGLTRAQLYTRLEKYGLVH